MNVNVYLENDLAHQVSNIAKRLHKSRNAIIREALQDWVQRYQGKQWPASILNFEGVRGNFIPFEEHRKELITNIEDPLA